MERDRSEHLFAPNIIGIDGCRMHLAVVKIRVEKIYVQIGVKADIVSSVKIGGIWFSRLIICRMTQAKKVRSAEKPK